MRVVVCVWTLLCGYTIPLAAAEKWPPAMEPLMHVVDLNVGESISTTLADGTSATVKLLEVRDIRDDLRQAVRETSATVEVNGQKTSIVAGNYHLPITVGGVQVDCPATKALVQPDNNPWAIEKDARLRLWPAGSPWIEPGTFVYPARQRWFATSTQMANEPVFVNNCEIPADKSIYYHAGLDIGGTEGLVEVISATDAIVISAGIETIDPPDYPSVVAPRYDVVNLRDGRGWYYRYSHLMSIDPAVKPGVRVNMGQKVGVLGKEGASGGWSHVHFDISALQPSGKYGIVEGYAFLWQAYHAEHNTQLQAVARPHHIAWAGQSVLLDGRCSWSAEGSDHIVRYQWLFCDGTTADGLQVSRSYQKPGQYSEILKVTDADGASDFDVVVVQVFDRQHPDLQPPAIHAAYWPTFGLKAGDEVTFKVRTFGNRPDEGSERWDFGDNTPPVEVRSDGNAHVHAKDGYAITKHQYAKSGAYLVSVARTNDRGETATARLHVHIE